MSFSVEWDRRYAEGTHLSIWPWSDLVSLTMRYARAQARGRVLELGCGAGANIPFFLSLGADYHAVEGSETIVKKLRERYPQLAGRIVAGDFTRSLPFDGAFDLVVDRGALTHNTTAAIRNALELAGARMKPGARYIGTDWFSTEDSDFAAGRNAGDANTRDGYDEGKLAGTGRVHFSDQAHLGELFRSFSIVAMEHKTVRQAASSQAGRVLAVWNLVAERRNT